MTRQTSLTENEKTPTFESETAETLNNFFSNIVKKLEIPKFSANDLVTASIKDPVFKAVLKYKHHQNILATQKCSKNKVFHFKEVNIGKAGKEILKLDKTKASQKKRYCYWNHLGKYLYICRSFMYELNRAIKSASFPFSLKLPDVTPLHKKGREDIKENYMWITIPHTRFLIMWMILSHTLSEHIMPCLNGFNTNFWKKMLADIICFLKYK